MPPLPARSRSLLPGALCAAGALWCAGCSGDGSNGGGILGAIFGPPATTTTANSTRPSQDDEPMTLFEKRRLIARIQQDPQTVQRLSPRERRELAAMIKSAQSDDDRRE